MTVARSSAAHALVQLSQKKIDWDNPFLVRKLQDPESAWRIAAAHILAQRPQLEQNTLDELHALRNDRRPWVKIRALGALAEIAKEKIGREKETK